MSGSLLGKTKTLAGLALSVLILSSAIAGAGSLLTSGNILFVPASAVFPGTNGKIAFSSERDDQGSNEIFIMNPDGSDPTNLTNSEFENHDPNFGIQATSEPPVTEYVLNSGASCLALPTIGGSAIGNNEAGADCMIPDGVTLDLTGISLTTIYPDYLSIMGDVIIDRGSIHNQGVEITYYGGSDIYLTDGSRIEQGLAGSFSGYGTVNIDSSSSMLNMGHMSFSGPVHNSGTITNECGAIIAGKTNIVGNAVVELCAPGTYADATNQATGQSMYAGGRTFYGERFGPGAEITGKVVDCVTVEMRKHGSPTGTAQIGFYDNSLSDPNKIVLDRKFGEIDVNTLTTGYKAYEFCDDKSYIVRSNLMVGVKYLGGDPINRIDVRRSNTGAGPDYDGLAAYHVNLDSTWHNYNTEGNSRDLLFQLTKTS